MMAVSVEPGVSLRVESAEVLFAFPYFARNQLREYDLPPDGLQFLVLKDPAPTTDTATVPQAILVKNWFEELRQRVPVN